MTFAPLSLALANQSIELPLKIRRSTESECKEILHIHNQAFGEDEHPVITKNNLGYQLIDYYLQQCWVNCRSMKLGKLRIIVNL